MQYEAGRGDYTVERRELFSDLTLDEAIARIQSASSKQD
jgi:hypothetical protein